MDLSKEISEVCRKHHRAGRGVFPPQVCPYCFGCPLATIVVGCSGNNQQRAALNTPDDHVQEVRDWLGRVEAKLS